MQCSGKLTRFHVGFRLDQDEEDDDGVLRYAAVANLGIARRALVDLITEKIGKHLVPVDAHNPSRFKVWGVPGSGKVPDYTIDPRDSIVLEVNCAQIIEWSDKAGNLSGWIMQQGSVVRWRDDLKWYEAITEAHIGDFAMDARDSGLRYPPAAPVPTAQKKRSRGDVDGTLTPGADVVVDNDVFRGTGFVLSLLEGREADVWDASGDCMLGGSSTDVLGSLCKLVRSNGGVVVGQPLSSSDLLVSVGDDRETSQRHKNAVDDGKHDIVTLAWALECVRRGRKIERGYFDYVYRSKRTAEALCGRYLRFGLPKRESVDIADVERIYDEAARQCDESDCSLAVTEVNSAWPDTLAAGRLPEWRVFEGCRAYFDWFGAAAGLTGPDPRVREAGTPPDLLEAGYLFVRGGGARLSQLTPAATHVIVADEGRASAVREFLGLIGSNADVVPAAWVRRFVDA